MDNRLPVVLTFDLDGETLWRCRDPENADKPVTLSQGRYGPETGLPRILKLLDKYGINATFFVPGFTAEQYPEKIKEIYNKGHEITGLHTSSTWRQNANKFMSMSQDSLVWPQDDDRMIVINTFDPINASDTLISNSAANFVPRFGNFVFTKVAPNVSFVERIKQPFLPLTASSIKIIAKRYINTTAIDTRWRWVANDMTAC